MNKIYIITYNSEEEKFIIAYDSESQAKHDMELMENILVKLDNLQDSCTNETFDFLEKEEQDKLMANMDNFESSLSKEEFHLFQYLKDFEYPDGDFEIKEVEIRYAN